VNDFLSDIVSTLSDRIFAPLMDRSIARLSDKLSLPSHLIALLLLVEDKRFMVHPGVDVIAVSRAFLKNLKRRKITQGASTITQQVYNIRYAATHTYGGRLFKKAVQATWAMCYTLTHSKMSVISEYLSGVYWGRSYHGIERASRGYFGVQPSELTVAQGFFLCERLASPNSASPERVSALINRCSISRYFLAQPDSLQELCNIYEHFFGCREVLSVLFKQHGAMGIRVDLMSEKQCSLDELAVNLEDTRGRRLPMKKVGCYSGLRSSGNVHCQRQLRQAASESAVLHVGPLYENYELGGHPRESVNTAARQEWCAKPELWHAPDGDSSEFEVLELCAAFIRALQPEVVVETGSAFGFGAAMMGAALKANGHGRLYSLEIDLVRYEQACERCKGLPVDVVYSDSMSWEPPAGIGFAFFDSRPQLRADEFRRYRPFMVPGAIVAFHDIAPHHTVWPRVHQLEREGLLKALRLRTPRGIALCQIR
jgi:predicted O-methyltransferase YrrM